MEFQSPGQDPRCKLSDEDKACIRARWKARPTYKSLADEYHVSTQIIEDAINNRNKRQRDRRYKERKKNARASNTTPA